MSKLSTQPYRGTRDFYPEDQFLFNYIRDVWNRVSEKYGYEEYNTPTIEPIEIYASKTSKEVVEQQTYSFVDRGERAVTIRPEMTPSVARLVASKRLEFGYPLRLYSVQNFMRYERPQKGRLREFWQLNVDLFGVEGIEAEFEMIKLCHSLMQEFGAKNDTYEIRVNSRVLLNNRIEAAGVKTSVSEVIRVIDSYDKLSREQIVVNLKNHVDNPEELLETIEKNGTTPELEDLLQRCKQADIKVKLYPTLARGFDYYNDIVFEVFDTAPENNRSMFGGGRYDNLVGMYGVESVPTVGFAVGDAVLIEFLKNHHLLPNYRPATDLYIVVVGDNTTKADLIADQFRNHDVNVAVDYSGRKPEKQLKTGLKHKIGYVLFVGDEEDDSENLTVKNLYTEQESTGKLEELVAVIKQN